MICDLDSLVYCYANQAQSTGISRELKCDCPIRVRSYRVICALVVCESKIKASSFDLEIDLISPGFEISKRHSHEIEAVVGFIKAFIHLLLRKISFGLYGCNMRQVKLTSGKINPWLCKDISLLEKW